MLLMKDTTAGAIGRRLRVPLVAQPASHVVLELRSCWRGGSESGYGSVSMGIWFRVALRISIDGVVSVGDGVAPVNRGTTESDRECWLSDIQCD